MLRSISIGFVSVMALGIGLASPAGAMGGHMGGHIGNVVGGLAPGTRDTSIVKEDDRTALRQSVGDRRVPVVESSSEMLQA